MFAVKPDVETAQVLFELDRLLDIFDAYDPAHVLEVGTWHGGTLWHWLQGGREVVSVDDTMFGAEEWESWALTSGSTLHMLQGGSQDREIVEQARALGPYDFVFIDADHTYNGVRSDWDNYRPMVAAGGVVAFHDIVSRPEYGVHQLWQEIKAEHPTVEIVEGSRPDYCGIGVVYL